MESISCFLDRKYLQVLYLKSFVAKRTALLFISSLSSVFPILFPAMGVSQLASWVQIDDSLTTYKCLSRGLNFKTYRFEYLVS